MMKFVATFLVTFLFLLAPGVVGAHSWGTSHEDEVNGYALDIGYSSPAPEVGEAVIFDFEILRNQERFHDFSDVWVRIEGERGTTLATGVHNAEFGGSRLSYVFPYAGEYTVSARYQNEDEAIASTEFTLTVVGGAVANTNSGGGFFSSSNLIGIAVGLVIGFVVTSLVYGRRS
ncbi:MAG: hypothetical protein ACJKTH_03815 [Patescibacteria group bacterium UBA2163]